MLSYHDPALIDDAGDTFHVSGFAIRRGWMELDGPPYDQECEIFGACAGAAMYRRAMLDDIGLFDEDFFANGEDVDLSFRAQLAGYKCLYVPDAVVYHKGGASIGQNARWFYWIRRNLLWVLMKDMPGALLLKYLPYILIYHLSSLVYHILTSRARLICRAYLDAFQSLPKVLSQRKEIQCKRRVSVAYLESLLATTGPWHRMAHPITRRSEYLASYRVKS